MQSGSTAVLLVSFPHQLLHALSALKFDRRLRSIVPDAPVILLIWSHQWFQHREGSTFRVFFGAALRDYPNVKLVFPDTHCRLFHLSPYRKVVDRADCLRRLLADEAVVACYFSHDVSADRTAQSLMQAFPVARRVSYGDPPGFLYPDDPVARFNYFPQHPLKAALWATRVRGLEIQYSPECAIIAIDFRGRTGGVGEVHVLERNDLLETLRRIRRGLGPCLPDRLPNHASINVLVMGNFSNSRMTSRQGEMQLYEEICASHVRPGEIVYVKPHPGTDAAFVRQLIARLGACDARIFPDGDLGLPIELFEEFMAQGSVISVSSASVLIAYLFDCPVVHGLTDARVRRFFRSEYVPPMLTSNQAILARLRETPVAGPHAIGTPE